MNGSFLNSQNASSREKNLADKRNSGKVTWKHLFLIPAGNRLITIFDVILLAVTLYSVLTSSIFFAFHFPICIDWIYYVESVVTVFFTLEILTKFMRIPENETKFTINHSQIAFNYVRSGQFLFQVLATIPFYEYLRLQECQADLKEAL